MDEFLFDMTVLACLIMVSYVVIKSMPTIGVFIS